MRPLSSGLGNGIYMKLRKTLNNSSKKTLNKQKMGLSQYSHSNTKSFPWYNAQDIYVLQNNDKRESMKKDMYLKGK
jgi:hypothetical protein